MKKYSLVALFKYAQKSLRKNSQSGNYQQDKKIYEYMFICSDIHIMTNVKFGTKNKTKGFSSGNKKRILPPHACTRMHTHAHVHVYDT